MNMVHKMNDNQIINDVLTKIDGGKLYNSYNDPVGYVVATADSIEVFSIKAYASKTAHTIEIDVSGQQSYSIIIIDDFIDTPNTICIFY